jgi:hypothetical protein
MAEPFFIHHRGRVSPFLPYTGKSRLRAYSIVWTPKYRKKKLFWELRQELGPVLRELVHRDMLCRR